MKTKVKAAKAAETPAKEGPSKIYRVLSTVMLVNSEEFAKAGPLKQTKTLKEAGGLPIEFVENFHDLANRRIIRDKLLSGEDISRELEFNNVVLTPEEVAAFAAITPVLKKIEEIGPQYDWLPKAGIDITVTVSGSKVCKAHHFVSKAIAKGIWDKASRFWSGGDKPNSHYVRANGSYSANHQVLYARESVAVGCQRITRAELEHVARLLKWEPNLGN